VQIRHPLLMSHQPACRHLNQRLLPNAERLVKNLSIHEKLTGEQIDYVAESIAELRRTVARAA
jgi:hypothetical protein